MLLGGSHGSPGRHGTHFGNYWINGLDHVDLTVLRLVIDAAEQMAKSCNFVDLHTFTSSIGSFSTQVKWHAPVTTDFHDKQGALQDFSSSVSFTKGPRVTCSKTNLTPRLTL